MFRKSKTFLTHMKVGILELGSETHYSPVILRARLFCEDPDNEVTIFTSYKMVPSLLPLNGYPNVRIISLELGKSGAICSVSLLYVPA
jgi:hypothetical protein